MQFGQSWLIYLIIAGCMFVCILCLLFALFLRARKFNRHHALLSVANSAAALLLEADVDDFSNALVRAMEMIGKCINVDRVSIWCNIEKDDGRLYYKLVNQWATDSLPDLDFESEFAYDEIMPNWKKSFSSGEHVNGAIENLHKEEYEQLSVFGIKSMLALPIFLKSGFWGFVSFDDYRKNRFFSELEVYALRSWGLLAVGAVKRFESVRDMLSALSALEITAKAAQSANRAKTMFLANMSHEIRTPMNAIIGMVSIGKNAADTERKDYCYEKIEDASKHLLGVINDILDMSKIEANRFDLSQVEFNFKKMLDSVLGIISFRLNEKKQSLNVDIDENIPKKLIGDDQRLAQVLTNLLGNAVKFTPKGGLVDLDARLIMEEHGVCLIKFSISDTGIGISPEQHSRLFNTFQQAEASTTRKFGGTGLGLTISKGIVELMGGEIWVESELGEGATFSFTIQAKRCGEGPEQDHEHAGESDKENEVRPKTGLSFPGRRILLTEDIEINREIIRAMLEPTLLDIDCAENGAEAVRMFENAPDKYDLILMDLQMPEMDGYDATLNIRASDADRAKTIPIIAMTANVFREDVEMCLSVGMNDHIGKPVDFDELFQLLSEYL